MHARTAVLYVYYEVYGFYHEVEVYKPFVYYKLKAQGEYTNHNLYV